MAERYQRLSSIPGNQYAVGSPILIAAGALLKDNQTGKVLAQIKFKSISAKQIKAIKVSVSAFDVSGKELEGVREYQYLDLSATRDEEFGQKQAIPLPDAVTRSFQARCTNVVFADGTSWDADPSADWTSLLTQTNVADQLGNLAAQYQRDTSPKSRFIPMAHKDLWFCSCGALNHDEETKCHNCHLNKEILFAALDLDTLQQRDDAHKAAEAEKEAEKKAKQAEAAKVLKAKIKKIVVIATAVFAVITVIMAITALITNVIIPNIKYSEAVALMESGEYDEAIRTFTALNGHRDSLTKIADCETVIFDIKYNEAVALMESGEYDEAIAAFKAIGGYKDSAEKAKSLSIEYTFEKVKGAKVGDYVIFGTYEQDNDTTNGKEDIEWLVLEVKDGKALVISKYALDCLPGNDYTDYTTWANCSLRTYLNYDFFDVSFTFEEKMRILKVVVSAGKEYFDRDKYDEFVPYDRIFILTQMDILKYYESYDAARCVPTPYAVATGVVVNRNTGYCNWLLREEVEQGESFSIIHDGADTTLLYLSQLSFRPSMWIDISESD